MRKGLLILVAAALLGVVAGCSSGANPAKQGSVEPAEDVFTRVGGWIAFRNGFEIVAVDPANPKDTLVLGPSLDDPIAWSSDGTKLLLRSRQEEDGIPFPLPGLFVLHPDGSRTTLVREIPSAPSAAPGRTRRARFSRVRRGDPSRPMGPRSSMGMAWPADPSSSTRTEASLARRRSV